MLASLTEKGFSQHLNSKFQLKLDDREMELELVEVKGYPGGPNEQSGMERFMGDKGPYLQHWYQLPVLNWGIRRR